jgi:hypothetical protein
MPLLVRASASSRISQVLKKAAEKNNEPSPDFVFLSPRLAPKAGDPKAAWISPAGLGVNSPDEPSARYECFGFGRSK